MRATASPAAGSGHHQRRAAPSCGRPPQRRPPGRPGVAWQGEGPAQGHVAGREFVGKRCMRGAIGQADDDYSPATQP